MEASSSFIQIPPLVKRPYFAAPAPPRAASIDGVIRSVKSKPLFNWRPRQDLNL